MPQVRHSARRQRVVPHQPSSVHCVLRDFRVILGILKILGFVPMYKIVSPFEICAHRGILRRYTQLVRLCNMAAIIFIAYSICSGNFAALFKAQSKLDTFNTMLDFCIQIFCYITLTVMCVHNSSRFICIINQLLQLDQQLRCHNSAARQLPNKCEFINKYLLILILFVCYYTVVLSFAWIDLNIKFTLYVYMLQDVISAIFMVFSAGLLQLLTVRFRYINQLLNAYTTQMRNGSQGTSQALWQVRTSDDNKDKDTADLMSKFPADAVFIHDMHIKLLDLYNAINDYVKHTLLVFMGFSFYTITETLYDIVIYLRSQDELHLLMQQWSLMWLCSHVMILALISKYCGQATAEANSTTPILARVYGKSKEYENIIDKYLTKSIKQDVQFTAYGFFVVDNSTLFKIFSAVTTYLVILIQFKQLEDSKAEDT